MRRVFFIKMMLTLPQKKKLVQSEQSTEFVLKFLSLNYPRIPKYVKDIEFPWAEYFDDKMSGPVRG